jgi:transposase
MEQILQRCAGLDIQKAMVVATVRIPDGDGGRRVHTETFSTTTSLLALHDSLQAYGVTHIAMESTGVWRPVHYTLEDSFTLLLVNARHVKRVPGRKIDVKDSEWLAQLLECVCFRVAFIPPPPIRDLRDLTRYRRKQIDERGHV